MYYHASPVPGIQTLTPHVSNHGRPLTYFSTKRENTLVYLSNAVEKYCKETGFVHEGPYHKWATYGFDCAGLLVLDEYYPDATRQTYQGVSGYIYRAENVPGLEPMTTIPGACITEQDVPVSGCEFIPDAYEALLEAAAQGKIILRKYEDNSEKMLAWCRRTALQEYAEATDHPEYRAFLKAKFDFL